MYQPTSPTNPLTTHQLPPLSLNDHPTPTFEELLAGAASEEESGLKMLQIKPRSPKNLHRIQRPIIENPHVTKVRLYTSKLTLGGAWQGEIIAPIKTAQNKETVLYQVKNVWLELIRYQESSYTFRIQAAFMVSLPEIVYLYKQNSRIVVNDQAVKLNG